MSVEASYTLITFPPVYSFKKQKLQSLRNRAQIYILFICHTINAKSIIKTYNVEKDERLKSFSNILDRRGAEEKPQTIAGSGYLHEVTFWVNARGSSNKTKSLKGSITAAINNWDEYFAVRFKKQRFLLPVASFLIYF